MDLNGRRILVVEDEFFIVCEIADALEDAGAILVGPTSSLSDTIALLEREPQLDAAVLDVHVRGEFIYPAAELLRDRGVPFIFSTGYDGAALPEVFAAAPRLQKPLDLSALVRALAELLGNPRAP